MHRHICTPVVWILNVCFMQLEQFMYTPPPTHSRSRRARVERVQIVHKSKWKTYKHRLVCGVCGSVRNSHIFTCACVVFDARHKTFAPHTSPIDEQVCVWVSVCLCIENTYENIRRKCTRACICIYKYSYVLRGVVCSGSRILNLPNAHTRNPFLYHDTESALKRNEKGKPATVDMHYVKSVRSMPRLLPTERNSENSLIWFSFFFSLFYSSIIRFGAATRKAEYEKHM